MKTSTSSRMLPSPHQRPASRVVAAFAAAALASGGGCVAHRSRPVPITQMSLEKEGLTSRRVRISTSTGMVELQVRGLAFPFVEGSPETSDGLVQLDLRSAHSLYEGLRDPETGTLLATLRVPLEEGAFLPPPRLAAPIGRLERKPAFRPKRVFQFGTDNGNVLLEVVRAQFPTVWGRPFTSPGWVRVDLREASRVEVLENDDAKTVIATLGAAVGVLGVAMIIVALTKESCPFVYVDRGRGPELVGEAYAGAAFRSLERDDLLPLPQLPEGRVVLRLRNEARETQFTDRAELVLVEAPEGLRALSDHAAQTLLVGAAATSRRVADLDGRDVTEPVAVVDGSLWQTDLVDAASANEPRLSEGLVAEFGDPPARPILEIVGGNTPWLDLVFGRFLAALGDRLDRFFIRWNDAAAGDRLREFKDREGLDLAVEVARASRWERVATVPTVGPIALRRVGIPLPEPASNPLRVRLRGGLGFWRIDALALSSLSRAATRVERLAPVAAAGTGSLDAIERVSANDGRFHVLREIGERVDLFFDVPPAGAGARWDAFLHTTGYYNAHRPIQARWAPGTLRGAGRKSGGFSRFSLDLARTYLREGQDADARPAERAGRPWR